MFVLQFPGDDMASASSSRAGVALPFEKSQLTLKGEWHHVKCLSFAIQPFPVSGKEVELYHTLVWRARFCEIA